MNLSVDQVKVIIAKVHDDLNLTHSDKYPIFCTFHTKDEKGNSYKMDYWGGGYDYRDPGAVGDDAWGLYPEYIISIDDAKGEAFAYHYYTGHLHIHLNEEGKYVEVGKLFELKNKG